MLEIFASNDYENINYFIKFSKQTFTATAADK